VIGSGAVDQMSVGKRRLLDADEPLRGRAARGARAFDAIRANTCSHGASTDSVVASISDGHLTSEGRTRASESGAG